MSVVLPRVVPCIRERPSMVHSAYPGKGSTTARSPGALASQSRPSRSGVPVSAAFLAGRIAETFRAVRTATAHHLTNARIRTCWVSILATATWSMAGRTCSRCPSGAATLGQGCSLPQRAQCMPLCPYQASSADSVRDVLRSRVLRSTGHACFHSMGRG
jgi:hypothetical protein